MKYSFMTFSTEKINLDENLNMAAKYGYQGIEIRLQAKHAHGIETNLDQRERRAVKEKFQKSGIELCALATSLQFSNTPEREKMIERTKEVCELASDLNVPLLRVFGGPIPEGTSREQSIKETVKTLSLVMDKARESGVTLCFETHDDWCNPLDVKAVIEGVNHTNLAVNWDILHPVRAGFATIEESFAILKPWIKHTHIHDGNFTTPNPDSFEFTPMGEGMIDHKTALRLLKKGNYQGFISGEWINFQSPEEHLPREISVLREYENSFRDNN